LDYAPLTVLIDIIEENIVLFKYSITKNSEEKSSFIKDISHAIKSINVSNLSNSNKLEEATIFLTSSIYHIWKANSKQVKIMNWSKIWWNEEYSHTLNEYRATRSLKKWKSFKNKVKSTKRTFFDNKIQEIVNKR